MGKWEGLFGLVPVRLLLFGFLPVVFEVSISPGKDFSYSAMGSYLQGKEYSFPRAFGSDCN